jgi:hypothetical protein
LEGRTPFLDYAFTDLRRIKLGLTVEQMLQDTVLQTAHGRIHVVFPAYKYTEIAMQFKRDNPNASGSVWEAWTLSMCDSHPEDYEAWLEKKAHGTKDRLLSDPDGSVFDLECWSSTGVQKTGCGPEGTKVTMDVMFTMFTICSSCRVLQHESNGSFPSCLLQ